MDTGLFPVLSGSGESVVDQEPEPGKSVRAGSKVMVIIYLTRDDGTLYTQSQSIPNICRSFYNGRKGVARHE